MSLSAVDCIQPAIKHARETSFNPFRWGLWLRLALVGVLAAELRVGGCNFTGLSQLASHKNASDFLPQPFPLPHIDPARIGQFAGLIGVILLLLAILIFVFLYVNSVFRFVLFDSVVQRDCSLGDGWQRRHREGGRFFLWQLVFQISAGLFFLLLVGVPLAIAAAAGLTTDTRRHLGSLVGGVVLFIGFVLVFALVASAVQVLARDFLVPIMALEGLDFADGWSRLLAMIRPEPGAFAIYLLLKLALSIVAAVLFSILAIFPAVAVAVPAVVTVLLGAAAGLTWNVITISLAVICGTVLVMVLIYLISFVSVPAIIFFPAYSLYFLAGRYPRLANVLNPAPVAAETPVVLPSPLLAPEPPPLPPEPIT
jgi:hypothetical protein